MTDQNQIAVLVAVTGEGPGPASYFRADLQEVVLTRLGEPADHLLIESWHAGRGLRRVGNLAGAEATRARSEVRQEEPAGP